MKRLIAVGAAAALAGAGLAVSSTNPGAAWSAQAKRAAEGTIHHTKMTVERRKPGGDWRLSSVSESWIASDGRMRVTYRNYGAHPEQVETVFDGKRMRQWSSTGGPTPAIPPVNGEKPKPPTVEENRAVWQEAIASGRARQIGTDTLDGVAVRLMETTREPGDRAHEEAFHDGGSPNRIVTYVSAEDWHEVGADAYRDGELVHKQRALVETIPLDSASDDVLEFRHTTKARKARAKRRR